VDKIKINLAGENALIIYFSDQASASVAATILKAQQLIRQNLMTQDCHIVIDIVPSYASIMVMYDMELSDHHEVRIKLRALLNDVAALAGDVSADDELANNETSTDDLNADVIELPVYYGEEAGPDLEVIAKRASLSIEEVIEIHQAQAYRVYAIGFAPGFAYLGEVDPRIAAPRLSTPRLKVPKGAVAIADRQTAVYPNVSPGGWNIIGLCPVDMFNPDAEPIMPVKVGDKVRFKPIAKETFLAMGGEIGEIA
jgi:KipI family sensor histidine kinase inhibitor